MNNYRPLLTFAVVLVVVGAGFWVLLTYSSHYERRLANKPQPVVQTPKEQPKSTSSQPPTNTNSNNNPPKNNQSQPQKQPERPKETPKANPTPTPAPSSPQPTQPKATTPATGAPSQVPQAGIGSDTLLTAVFVAIVAFLLMQLRKQAVMLRPRNLS